MADERPTLYLVDGSGYIYRAFYALQQLTTSRGTPTNAVYGFVRMLVKLLKDARPSHVAVVFDSPKKGFRDDLFESYKATRAATTADRHQQSASARVILHVALHVLGQLADSIGQHGDLNFRRTGIRIRPRVTTNQLRLSFFCQWHCTFPKPKRFRIFDEWGVL